MSDATSELLLGFSLDFPSLVVEEIRSRSWASATFAGVRHELTMRLEGDGAEACADAFLHGLEEREFDLRGHILADIALVSQTRATGLVRLSLEALTLEAG